mmetsp:Transcript_5388/g.22800  ORF Transcript_5388/g.22800 Transcript_5388/m.22800 type:complete len:213 (-) Transcript_5388:632-1270(-)
MSTPSSLIVRRMTLLQRSSPCASGPTHARSASAIFVSGSAQGAGGAKGAGRHQCCLPAATGSRAVEAAESLSNVPAGSVLVAPAAAALRRTTGATGATCCASPVAGGVLCCGGPCMPKIPRLRSSSGSGKADFQVRDEPLARVADADRRRSGRSMPGRFVAAGVPPPGAPAASAWRRAGARPAATPCLASSDGALPLRVRASAAGAGAVALA